MGFFLCMTKCLFALFAMNKFPVDEEHIFQHGVLAERLIWNIEKKSCGTLPYFSGRQTAMFSATFGTGVQHLAADFLDSYTFVAVGRVGSAAQTVEQRLLWVEDRGKKKSVELVKFHDQLTETSLQFTLPETNILAPKKRMVGILACPFGIASELVVEISSLPTSSLPPRYLPATSSLPHHSSARSSA